MAEPPTPVSRLDRPTARFFALGVVAAVLALVAYIHRAELFPREAATVAGDDPAALCFAARAADIDRMLDDGTISAGQAGLFKNRAEALCQAQFGESGAAPPQ